MHRVSIVKGPRSPDTKAIRGMIEEAIDLVGGFSSLVERGCTVALKPNIVTGKLSGRGVTTDPLVVEALIKIAFEAGAGEVLIVEGSGYGAPTREAFDLSSMREAAERSSAIVVDVDEDVLVDVEVPEPLILDKVSVSKRFWEADIRINVPVMKTHDQMLMTLGMKNMKGVIPKPQKRLFHRVGLSKAIVDLNKAVSVDLTVVDAIHAMEGLGPSLGEVFEMDVVMASKDIFSLDVVGAWVMGFSPKEVEYLKLASEQGLVGLDGEQIEVVGEPLSDIIQEFKRPPMDLAPQEGIIIVEEGACSACRGTIRSVFYDLERKGLLSQVEGLNILVGPYAEMPEQLKEMALIMGTCLQRLEDEGRYVVGCPPNNDKMVEAIRELCGL